MAAFSRRSKIGLKISLSMSIILGLNGWQTNLALADEPRIVWHDFDESIFVDAKKQDKFVLLDLEAVWCHWCHVMDKETYADPVVVKLLNDKYICVRVDQDARPDLSSKYEDYGWPATIIFNSDGGEIVKRAGYLNPQRMARLLDAIIKDPSAEEADKSEETENTDSATQAVDITAPGGKPALNAAIRTELLDKFKQGYDPKYGGWGTYQKFLDFDTAEYAISQACDGEAEAAKMARGALDGELNLVDPVFGGVYQYSTDGDWAHPHFEKIMQTQAENMRIFSLGYKVFKDKRYLAAAQAIAQYLNDYLTSPEGGFYTSQDADLKAGEHSGEYFSLNKAGRLKLGIPTIDRHVYARENGWAVNGLCELYAASGDPVYLARAILAADHILANRALPNGGFSHNQSDRAGPYLGDSLAMGRAFLSLYRVTGDRKWLGRAELAANFIEDHFKATTGQAQDGYNSAVAGQRKMALPEPLLDENVTLARFANLLFQYTGDKKYVAMADRAMSYLSQPAVARRRKVFVGGVLLADKELHAIPTHITVVGAKSDAAALALFRCATSLPATFARVEWWDSKEGPLPNTEVELPQLGKAAAFLCTAGRCSTPAYDPQTLAQIFGRTQSRAEK